MTTGKMGEGGTLAPAWWFDRDASDGSSAAPAAAVATPDAGLQTSEPRVRRLAGGPPGALDPRSWRGRTIGLALFAVAASTVAVAMTAGAMKPDPVAEQAGLGTQRTEQEAERRERARVAELERRRTDVAADVARLERERSALRAEIGVAPSPASSAPDVAGDLAALERRRDTLAAEISQLTATASLAPETPALETADDGADALAGAPLPQPRPADLPVTSVAVVDPVETVAPAARGHGVVRVFLHVAAGDAHALARARTVAAALRAEGIEVPDIRVVRYAVRTDAVRFFYDADRSSVSLLQNVVRGANAGAPVAQDYRRYRAPPRPGTIELWFS